ncbi:MAG: hypothetical protein LBT46_12475 [Planctomycetaceae bacterium]|nr:hypothetical protein [Planctomycetaceae bacterium]
MHCRKQEGDKNTDDGDDDEEFDESEAYPTGLFSLLHLREVNFAALCCGETVVNMAFSF